MATPPIHTRSVLLDRTRNLGIMAHVDAGKTTTTERILFYAGATSRLGEVNEGSTVTDWMTQEQERGISIVAAATTVTWADHVINLIDTPGHVDFTMEVERSLRVLDGAIAVFSAVEGVEPQSETVWRQADRYHIPRIAFINKLDREGADPARVVEMMVARLGAHPIVTQLAVGLGPDFDGVIDLVTMQARTWDAEDFGASFTDGPIPESHAAEAAAAREQMLAAVAEHDDELMAAWVSGPPLAAVAITAAIRRVTLAGAGVPTLVGAAFANLGIHNLLDAVIAYLPSPADVGPVRGRDPADPTAAPTLVRAASDEAPLAAFAFKVQVDDPGGMLAFVRVYSGRLETGAAVLVPSITGGPGRRVEIGRLVRMFANHREEIDVIEAGMIGAVVDPHSVFPIATGVTLCDPRHPILLDAMTVPSPVMGIAIEPETDDDHARLPAALERLALEDPSFRVRTDPESGQLVIAGMGELHLEIIVDRLRRELGIRCRVGNPRVAYRETITRRSEADEAVDLGHLARGSRGHVRLVVEPTDRGGGYVFENHAPDAEIPREHAPAVEAGISEAVERGVLSGHPLTDLRVQVVGGSYHPVDSNDYAYKLAGGKALVAAASTAGPTVLEPIMSLEVTTPDANVGEVLGDLHARRGKVAGISARAGVQTLACFVPMASMFGYSTVLRSASRGRATYAMEFDHYAEAPQQVRDDLSAPKLGRGAARV